MKNTLHIILAFILGTGSVSFAQPGCQDPQATNFNPAATSTNSSCLYSTTSAPLANKINAFPASCAEASSLLFTDGKIFTNNDSGNTPVLFQLDTTSGAIVKSTTIAGYVNEDWEDLAADSQFIYIGDFGNNDGQRTNLKILKVKKSSLYNPDSTTVHATAIRFNYPDQTSFALSSTHNFDCESFFYHRGLLHLFSKNRGNKKTKHYTVDPNLANQAAVLIDSLNVNGLITGATIRTDGKVACLLGYDQSNFTVFAWLLFGYDSTNYFGGNRRRLELPGGINWTQAEGIGFRDTYRLWISNETLGSSARMRQLNARPYLSPFFTENQELRSNEAVNIWPNPVKDKLRISDDLQNVRIYTAQGIRVLDTGNNDSRSEIDFSTFSAGLYFLRAEFAGKPIFARITKE